MSSAPGQAHALRYAPAASARYAVRAGGWIAAAEKDLATVMMERFGHPHGYVGGEYGLPE